MPASVHHRSRAVEAFARFGTGRHPAGLGVGDCLTYALAASTGEEVLCLGEEVFRVGDDARTDLRVAPVPS